MYSSRSRNKTTLCWAGSRRIAACPDSDGRVVLRSRRTPANICCQTSYRRSSRVASRTPSSRLWSRSARCNARSPRPNHCFALGAKPIGVVALHPAPAIILLAPPRNARRWPPGSSRTRDARLVFRATCGLRTESASDRSNAFIAQDLARLGVIGIFAERFDEQRKREARLPASTASAERANSASACAAGPDRSARAIRRLFGPRLLVSCVGIGRRLGVADRAGRCA